MTSLTLSAGHLVFLGRFDPEWDYPRIDCGSGAIEKGKALIEGQFYICRGEVNPGLLEPLAPRPPKEVTENLVLF